MGVSTPRWKSAVAAAALAITWGLGGGAAPAKAADTVEVLELSVSPAMVTLSGFEAAVVTVTIRLRSSVVPTVVGVGDCWGGSVSPFDYASHVRTDGSDSEWALPYRVGSTSSGTHQVTMIAACDSMARPLIVSQQQVPASYTVVGMHQPRLVTTVAPRAVSGNSAYVLSGRVIDSDSRAGVPAKVSLCPQARCGRQEYEGPDDEPLVPTDGAGRFSIRRTAASSVVTLWSDPIPGGVNGTPARATLDRVEVAAPTRQPLISAGSTVRQGRTGRLLPLAGSAIGVELCPAWAGLLIQYRAGRDPWQTVSSVAVRRSGRWSLLVRLRAGRGAYRAVYERSSYVTPGAAICSGSTSQAVIATGT
ncbi:MAG: hypothetical protein IPJ14_13205 [Kineosporiaceae bacterium]|nr:hypothetical protein [Kineosporiaceae bacterium]MBK7623581.1 hypothetical protein [Kineosporiaceae bacterium]MBK8077925.1 hypothetical protein [Kineosporiaceae bacterium]